MAVEIPVFIDIDKAFEDAASRIPQAMKPMQKYMDENALAIKLKIDDSGKKFYVKQILDDATISAKQLRAAIQDIGKKIKVASAVAEALNLIDLDTTLHQFGNNLTLRSTRLSLLLNKLQNLLVAHPLCCYHLYRQQHQEK